MAGQEFKNRIRVYKDFAGLPNIECKARELNQVLLNLLVNAARSIEGAGEIKTKLLKKAAIVLKFRDNGRGFSQDYLKRIFDPSFSTKGARVEMGLGLPIAYNIVKEHGGEITVESESGNGTEFTIILNKTLNRAISNETTAKESSANA